MKTLFLKKAIPVATAVLAMAGAFASNSMQSKSSNFIIKTGYVLEPNGECNIATVCSDYPSSYICRYGFGGPIAFEKNFLGNCMYTLWRL
ncbi:MULTISPECIES: DUF6520 family protein [Flavobacterium]|uniref:Uncharacterized protein n=1 Tax=Flavobacterium aquidurense TaxID=362413 RepID=A0A0Q0XUD3_9FLAO|nr:MULTISPECIES: DUF6520 family protein [Flavobacterium]KQB39843.1 hypothetical protein RC62_1537 [Flavobacterium aquidurense]OMQ11504.1 hypothetical protein BXU01_08125 [[Flexibacter] sp. ATCC 35103]